MKLKTALSIMIATVALTISCCGSGRSINTVAQTPAATSKVVKLRASGFRGKVSGVQLVLNLPTGVTMAANSTGQVSDSALAISKTLTGNTMKLAKYTAATRTTPGSVNIALISSSGFSAGEFLTLTCTIAPGVTPTFSNSLVESSVKVLDINGHAISGATVTLTVAN